MCWPFKGGDRHPAILAFKTDNKAWGYNGVPLTQEVKKLRIGLLTVSGFSASPSFWNTVFQVSSASTAYEHEVVCDAGVAMHLPVLRNRDM